MSQTTPIDQLIVDEIARLLRAISVDDGYRTNAGAGVLTEESLESIADDAITIEIIDDVETLDSQSRAYRRGKLSLKLNIDIPKGSSSRAVARNVLADVRRALTVEPRQLPSGFTGLEIGGRNLPPREDGSQFITATLNLAASFNEQQQAVPANNP